MRPSASRTGNLPTGLPLRCQVRHDPDPDRQKPESNLVDSFFQCFTGFETWFFGCCDFQSLTGLWVTTDASWTISDGESTETNQNNGVASLESASDGFDYCIQGFTSAGFGDVRRYGDSINQFRLVHSKSPYIYLSMILSFFGENKNEC
ncbi:hypothetical protein PSHI_47700 [Pseudomonas sp. URMO17WK12:I11]|nr:hypothetical protein PSHI_47700 [Pseudomonas sp. URMO17WK12:I11]